MAQQRPPMTGLRRIRERRGLTQAQVGKAIGRSTAFIAELELGRKGASIETLQRLAKVLNVSIDDLLQSSVADGDAVRVAR